MSVLRAEGKVALITGGARGMGASHARLLAEHGAAVAICDVLDDEGQATVRGLVGDGHRARYVPLDVADEAGWERAVADVEDAFGAVTVLVNNAGIAGGPVADPFEGLAGWARTVDVNQTGAYLGMRAVVPGMRRAGTGSIINISSILGFTGDADCIAYCATKGALRTMTRSAALKLASDGIRVNTVCPGIVRTPMNEQETDLGGYIEATPMKRLGEPIEISYAVLFLASDESSFVTGTDVVVDGGFLAQ